MPLPLLVSANLFQIFLGILLTLNFFFAPGCGPASLNALVRKIVAAQINPQRVMHGEMQGMLTLITEEFQW